MYDELQHIMSCDSKGNVLEGGKKYKLHLQSDMPASDFWSVIVYDTLNRLIIQTDQPWPSVFSSEKNLVYNNDGSVDVWFGPDSINGMDHNWIKTDPCKMWYAIMHLYFPFGSGFNKSWHPGQIEKIA